MPEKTNNIRAVLHIPNMNDKYLAWHAHKYRKNMASVF